ncbi:hypothetical protein ACHAWF_018892 [Thalassiosira exigua]
MRGKPTFARSEGETKRSPGPLPSNERRVRLDGRGVATTLSIARRPSPHFASLSLRFLSLRFSLFFPQHYACANEASESVLVLLAERRPSSKTSVDKRKRTPLHFALGHTERPASEEAVALLSDTGAALMPDENGMLTSDLSPRGRGGADVPLETFRRDAMRRAGREAKVQEEPFLTEESGRGAESVEGERVRRGGDASLSRRAPGRRDDVRIMRASRRRSPRRLGHTIFDDGRARGQDVVCLGFSFRADMSTENRDARGERSSRSRRGRRVAVRSKLSRFCVVRCMRGRRRGLGLGDAGEIDAEANDETEEAIKAEKNLASLEADLTLSRWGPPEGRGRLRRDGVPQLGPPRPCLCQIKVEEDRSEFQSASPVTLADPAAQRAMWDLIGE